MVLVTFIIVMSLELVIWYEHFFFVSAPQTVSDKLMAGFVECLDNEEAEEGTEKEDGE